GLKSIFHLCEGFVYAASVPNGEPGRPWRLDHSRTNLLTPWDLAEYHTEWLGFGKADREAIEEALRPFLPTGQHWFCLWIPLRRKDPCDLAPIRENEFPGEQPFPPEFLLDEVRQGCVETMQSLPLLSSLEVVRYWLPNASGRLERHEVRFEA